MFDILSPSLLKTQTFPPKEVSFTDALRLIAQFCLTKGGEFSTDGLQEGIEKMKSKIMKHILPKYEKQRHFTRKTKKENIKNMCNYFVILVTLS